MSIDLMIPFYKLESAVEILNNKLKTRIYTRENILAIALLYDLKLYVIAKNWEGDHISSFLKVDIENEDFNSDIILKKADDFFKRYIEIELNSGCLLQLGEDVILKLYNYGCWRWCNNDKAFVDILSLKHAITGEPKNHKISFMEGAIGLSVIYDICIHSIDIYLSFEGDDIFLLPRIDDDFKEIKDDSKYIRPLVDINDVVITAFELSKIINNQLTIKQQAPIDNTNLLTSSSDSQRGKSLAKVNAQLAAQTLADYLWRKDVGESIRIAEMALNVYAELTQTHHHKELPESVESLEVWIREIAEKYPHSRKPGRTKKVSN
ncbi:hypothetical protein GFH30_03235 [Acinetobacter wanghuae]|uniref:Uncharacterized protein n=1 Tax=Acinetobacter wanghuae TaxID=2662362 RepID=A0A5Q0P1I0_9GAMM|nr:hypothetical protein [Acinetobacter wanghuae]MQW92225.1 hypothetical protein [Acinetobacter wanghuae]QGA10472.1 hypothetical protein GFH30_03235 [Acinetobacter wanghuae]